MFSPELLRALADDRERWVQDDLRRRMLTSVRRVRWVRWSTRRPERR